MTFKNEPTQTYEEENDIEEALQSNNLSTNNKLETNDTDEDIEKEEDTDDVDHDSFDDVDEM